MNKLFYSAAIFLISALPSLGNAQPAGEVNGTGASFPALVYSAWTFAYTKERSFSVRYTPTGSSDGIKQITERKVDFGATDSPLSSAELKANKLIQFPTMVGGIVPVVNLNGVASGALKLTGPLLADLFSGEIKTWDDPRIAALNPGMRLPKIRVVRVVREEGSGTTETFTYFLSTQNPAWKDSIGFGKLVKWKGEVTAVKGNDGVAQGVKSTSGAIGYVSFDRVQRHGLTVVALRNASGQFVTPSEAGFQAAIKASNIIQSDAMSVSLVNLPGNITWPIVDITYILMDAMPKSAAKASLSAKFFYWAFLKGDALIEGTGFAPLPTEIQARAVRKLGEIQPLDGEFVQLF